MQDLPPHIPVFRPALGAEEIEAVRAAFESGWIGLGPKTREFEERFAEYIGVPRAVGLNSCSAALHLALKVAGVAGGEVITTPLTFVATNHAILLNDAKPVFVDVERDTLNIDPHAVERHLRPSTRAVVVVHYAGHPCDLDPILRVAHAHGVPVIEDAAHACGAAYKGRRIGSFGDLCCFSFHAIKNLTTGEGGMLTAADPRHVERVRSLRWLGINKDAWERIEEDILPWGYDVAEVGYKYHMNDIAAAIGLVQLRKLDQTNQRRRAIARQYTAAFADLGWVETPVEKDYARSAWHMYVIRVPERDRLYRFLKERGIDTGVHYVPSYRYAPYRGCEADCPTVEEVWPRLLTLPLYTGMTEDEVGRVVEGVRAFGERMSFDST